MALVRGLADVEISAYAPFDNAVVAGRYPVICRRVSAFLKLKRTSVRQ